MLPPSNAIIFAHGAALKATRTDPLTVAEVPRPSGLKLPKNLARIVWPYCPMCGGQLERPSKSGVLQGCAAKDAGGCGAAFEIRPRPEMDLRDDIRERLEAEIEAATEATPESD